MDKDDLDGLLPCFELDAPGRVAIGPLVDFAILCCGSWAGYKRQGESGSRDSRSKSRRRDLERSGSWSDDEEGGRSSEGLKMESDLQSRMARVAYKVRGSERPAA